ncbi:uncharacterized protein YndB with AHSA1/START domain [Pseudoclavibacter chungangensis]|nr:SRPBCC domain-containing protein [Pseudoclavibacter chungangensis]NYJ68269.1 uncharacterized protein YndB with AHSA1/START domain [Pseudoclavibacter chungangensis]
MLEVFRFGEAEGGSGMGGEPHDGVRFEFEVDAPIARAWSYLVEPRHVRAWWAFDGAIVDARPGGRIEHRWDEHGRYLSIVDEVDAPRRLTYRTGTLPDAEPVAGAQTRVRFELAEVVPGRTRIRVTEDGVSRLDLDEEGRRIQLDAAAQAWDAAVVLLTGLAASDEG